MLLLLLLSRFSRVQLCTTHRRQPTEFLHPWDSLDENTGVGCHFLLQCMKVKSESEVTQSCPTLRDPMDHSLPGCSIHRIFQARVLEWGAIAFSAYSVTKSEFKLRPLIPSPLPFECFIGFPIKQWCSGNEASCQCRRHKRLVFNPWVGKIPWNRKWNPLQYSWLENWMEQRSLAGYSP